MQDYDPNDDLRSTTWVRFTLPTGQEVVRALDDVLDADYEAATEVDVFREVRWEPLRPGGWMLYGTKDNGLRLPLKMI